MTTEIPGVKTAGAEVASHDGDRKDVTGQNKPTEANTAHFQIKPVAGSDKLGMWFFLGSEVILFGALILVYVVTRIMFPDQYAAFRSHLNIPLIAGNTLVLVLSSYFVAKALEAARNDYRCRMVIDIITVLLLGSIFIYGQAYEWSSLVAEGIRLDNTFGSPFFVVTGIHGTHVLVGLAWAALLLVYGINPGGSQREDRGVEIFGLYWHFVDIVWIVLFSLIYLL